MTHRKALLLDLDERIGRLLPRQITAEGDDDMVAAFVTEDSKWYLHEELKAAIQRDLIYMQRHQRPDGCFDLTPCNYASPPDTAFMVNAMLNGWWLLDKCAAKEADFIRKPMHDLIDSASRGTARPGASRRAAFIPPTTAGPFPPAC